VRTRRLCWPAPARSVGTSKRAWRRLDLERVRKREGRVQSQTDQIIK
jgi:hypothetical protein